MIRTALDSDLPQLSALWQEAFGDSEAETAFYFQHCHRNTNLLLMEDAGEITGMLSMLPLQLRTQQGALRARYIFAVATRKSRRSQGISTRLLNSAHELAKAQGNAATILVPAETGLFDYYQKRGYQTAFHIDERRVPARQISREPKTGHTLMPCAVHEYASIRDEFYGDSRLFALWDADALGFIQRSLRESGGDLVKFVINGRLACAACEPRSDQIRVLEMTVGKDEWEAALGLIHQAYKAKEYLVRLWAGTLDEAGTVPFGMIHWLVPPPDLSGTAPYLAFAKD